MYVVMYTMQAPDAYPALFDVQVSGGILRTYAYTVVDIAFHSIYDEILNTHANNGDRT